MATKKKTKHSTRASAAHARTRAHAAPKGAHEWVGGVLSMPTYVTGDGPAFRPEMLIWLSSEGAVVGQAVGRPGELVAQASASLAEAIARPLYGRPHTPTRLRVASSELAAALRASHGGIEIVCAPTPEMDDVMASLREHQGDDSDVTPSFLSADIGPARVAALFDAAADLYRAAPWALFPADHSLVSVSIDRLGVRDAVASILGQTGPSRGVIVFPSIDAFEGYLEGSAAMSAGDAPEMPPHLAMSFDRAADVDAPMRDEVAHHGWTLADADAYPSLLAIEDDLVVRPLVPRDLAVVEAVARAVVKLASDKGPLVDTWSGGPPITRTFSVATADGPVDVTVRAPHADPLVLARPEGGLLGDLFALVENASEPDGDLDEGLRKRLEEELVRRFLASPEGAASHGTAAYGPVMDIAASSFGDSVATLHPEDLRAIVFDLLPQQVALPPSAASAILDDLRAFYAFLKRDLGLKHADPCLRVVSPKAARKLAAALSDAQRSSSPSATGAPPGGARRSPSRGPRSVH